MGAVIDLTKAILANQIGNGAALFRPAGINAEKDRSFNGEFFNSIAAGAKYIRHGYSHHKLAKDSPKCSSTALWLNSTGVWQ